MSTLRTFLVVVLVVLSFDYCLAEVPDDPNAVKALVARVVEGVPARGASNVRFRVVRVDRVYEKSPRSPRVAIFYVYHVVEQRDLRGGREKLSLTYEWTRCDWRQGIDKFQGAWGRKLDNKAEYEKRIAKWDGLRQYRIVSRATHLPGTKPDTQARSEVLANPLLYAKTRAPSEVAARDADLTAAKSLLARVPPTEQLSGERFRAAAQARVDIFVRAHYHVGRIEMRSAAAAGKGRLVEKQRLLQEAIRKWASNLDTHSTRPPKPTMTMITVLEPAHEAFARRLAEAYSQHLAAIHQQLVGLLRQIAVDAGSPWAAEGAKSVAESLPVKAQDEKDRGRKSLGGQAQVDEFARLLGQAITPVLVEFSRTDHAQTPAGALAKLLEALAKAEAQIVTDAAKQRP